MRLDKGGNRTLSFSASLLYSRHTEIGSVVRIPASNMLFSSIPTRDVDVVRIGLSRDSASPNTPKLIKLEVMLTCRMRSASVDRDARAATSVNGSFCRVVLNFRELSNPRCLAQAISPRHFLSRGSSSNVLIL